jgi:HK97 family phage prohead protease
MLKEIEKRFFPRMELKLEERADQPPQLAGYIAVFNQPIDMYGWSEQIAPGAFADTISKDDIRALWNHENDLVLGRNVAGTLELSEDDTGLAFRNTPPDTTWVRDRLISLRRKDVTGSSFGFYTDVEEWATLDDGTKLRTLKRVTLVEVSPGVTFPAYPQTSTEVARRSMEAWLKEAGRSRDAELVVQTDLTERHLRLRQMSLR